MHNSVCGKNPLLTLNIIKVDGGQSIMQLKGFRKAILDWAIASFEIAFMYHPIISILLTKQI